MGSISRLLRFSIDSSRSGRGDGVTSVGVLPPCAFNGINNPVLMLCTSCRSFSSSEHPKMSTARFAFPSGGRTSRKSLRKSLVLSVGLSGL